MNQPTSYTAKTLAENIKDENFDIIFSGLQSDDFGFGQIGIILGELLNMSTATLAMSTELVGNEIKIKRELEAVFSVGYDVPTSIYKRTIWRNNPRYPSLKGIMVKKKKKKLTRSSFGQQQSIQKIYTPKSSKETVMIEGSTDEIEETCRCF